MINFNEKAIEEIRDWIIALESGAISQTRWELQNSNGFCCLGVGVALYGENYQAFTENLNPNDYSYGYLAGGLPSIAHKVPKWLVDINDDFSKKYGVMLSNLNDKGKSFKQIAKLLRSIYKEELGTGW